MKSLIYILSFLLIVSCSSNKTSTQTSKGYPFYVGTYTNKDSKGIYKYILQKDGTFIESGLQTKTKNPSFITFSADKTHIIAANKQDQPIDGSITSFQIQGDSLVLQNSITSGGVNPCYVSANDENYVLTANYGSGSVSLLHLNNDGHLSDLLNTQQHIGKGTTNRQKGPHAHSIYFEPKSNKIISVDLGTNSLWFYSINKGTNELTPEKPLILNMTDGAGPRHLTFHPNTKWIYVLNELNNTVTRVEKTGPESYNVKESISTLPNGFNKENTSADIHISEDGKFLYSTNRGHNSIAIFEVNPKDGFLKLIGNESTRGETPRNFSLSPNDDFLVVANQNTDNLVAFKRDKKNGTLKFTDEIKAPTPVCILFK